MTPNTKTSNERPKALSELLQDIDPAKAEVKISHWFESAVNNDKGADIEDINYYLSIIKFFRDLN